MSPKPAYLELMKLVKGTWFTTEAKAQTDENGELRFAGFLGDYVLESPSGKAEFSVEQAGKRTLNVGVAK
jgi:hypothetical protein